jgi:aminoglycoside phosphotransferase family enzyme/predicted kinase
VVRETHGSWVVLRGDRAWKVKKPVRWSFLDYGTLEARLAACREEVRVNAALAPRTYLGVRPVLADGEHGVRLGEEGEHPDAVEYVVEMRRYDERRTLAAVLGRGELAREDAAAVGRRIAAFHAEAQRVDVADPVGRLRDRIARDIDDLERAGAPGGTGALRGAADGILAREAPRIVERAARGLVRDGHGDLRAEHVLTTYGLPIVDRLEFDRDLRIADVADDLAFLAMDLESLGARWAADALLAGYREAGGFAAPAPLAAAFAWRRAVVRAKVARLGGDEGRTRALLGLADRLAWRARAEGVLVVCGPPASGKSTLAARLAERLEVPVLSSDVVRKAMLGVPARRRAGEEAYAQAVSERVYRELRESARDLLAEPGAGAVLDATYRTAAERDALDAALGGRVRWIWCDAPTAVLRERAVRRERDPQRVSDADAAVALRLARAFVPLHGDGVLRVGGEPRLAAIAAWLDGPATLI